MHSNDDNKKTTRRIVSWSPQEDEILREQIRINGTDNWAIIASRFTDKTTRQCRRRWYTYLNSDFKKGGWSPEEDILLCEAQKIFGNRWTEIAKVVSGRTDNAVKNRFSTLCKKRAKLDAVVKENTTSYVNLNNKRVIFQLDTNVDESMSETKVPLKKIRTNHIPDMIKVSPEGFGKTNQQPTLPVEASVHNFDILRELQTQASTDMVQGIYLKKDDPKIIALMQQAELLSSPALTVNSESTEQGVDNAWKILQEFLSQSTDVDMIRLRIADMDFQLESSADLTENLKSSREDSQQSLRPSELYADSPGSSEFSTGSTFLNHIPADRPECTAADLCTIPQTSEVDPQLNHIGQSDVNSDAKKHISCSRTDQGGQVSPSNILPNCDDSKANDGMDCAFSSIEFSSPFQATPLFRSFASGIPSPQFTESERHFLLKTLGVEGASPKTGATVSRPPPCKRALLQSL